MKNHFKRIKLRKSNYAIKSTDEELFYWESIQVQQYFWKVPLEVKLHNIKEKRGSEIKR